VSLLEVVIVRRTR